VSKRVISKAPYPEKFGLLTSGSQVGQRKMGR
jgi:hypothetical protein